MWLIPISFILAIFYFFNSTFQTVVNNIVAAFGNWVARNLHIPTWIMNVLRWVGRTFRGTLLFAVITTVVLSLVSVYSFWNQNPNILLYTMIATAVMLLVLIIAAQAFAGVGKFFGLPGTTGPVTKFGLSVSLWIFIQFGLLSVPNGWYMDNLLFIGLGTVVLIAFMYKGWYNDKPNKIAAGFLVSLFIASLIFSTYKNYDAGNIELPRWAQNTVEAYEAKMDAYSIHEKTEGQLVLASFWTPSISYYLNSKGNFNPISGKKYRVGDVVTVADKKNDPVLSYGESMLEVVKQNKYGDMLGTNVWVPARKVNCLSPAEFKEQQIKAAQARADSLAAIPQYDTVAVMSKVGAKWYPPAYGKTDMYWVITPPNTYLYFKDYEKFSKIFNNSGNNISRIWPWTPMSIRVEIVKLQPKNAVITILRKK